MQFSKSLTKPACCTISVLTIVIGLFVESAAVSAATTWHVDKNATDFTHNGFSWCMAFLGLHEALDVAVAGDTIRVADGVYTPDPTGLADRREATFQLKNGVTIEGGYAGCGAPNPDARNIVAFETILSGDFNGDDGPDFLNRLDNFFHVVTAIGAGATTVFDGFTVTGGNSSFASDVEMGAGMLIQNGSPTVRQCTFRENQARDGGGIAAISVDGSPSQPVFTGCTFIDNAAEFLGGGVYTDGIDLSSLQRTTFVSCTFSGNTAKYGGGMLVRSALGATVTNCTFQGNTVNDGGGGLSIFVSNATVTRCSFIENRADRFAGGLEIHNACAPVLATVVDCTFIGNIAQEVGGGIYSRGVPACSQEVEVINCAFFGNRAITLGGGGLCNAHSDLTLVNGLFSGNSAFDGGAIGNRLNGRLFMFNCTLSENSATRTGGGLYSIASSAPVLSNCVLWGNVDGSGAGESAQIAPEGSPFNVNYSCIQGLSGSLGGIGNIGDDPFFRDADGENGIVGTLDDDLRLSSGSRCIDAGSNSAVPSDTNDLDGDGNSTEPVPVDLDGNPRFFDWPLAPDTGEGFAPLVDMGALELGPDCNGNGVDDPQDIADGTSQDCNGNGVPDDCEADCNGNGIADECEVPPMDPTAPDCNANGIPDECDTDCQHNGLPDDCDINSGMSADINTNGIPDECECFGECECLSEGAAAPLAELILNQAGGMSVSIKNRYLSFQANVPGGNLAVRVTFESLPPPFDNWNGARLWAGPPSEVSENGDSVIPVSDSPTFNAATLQCIPFFTDWASLGVVHVFHEGIVPGGTYQVDVIDQNCVPDIEANFSASLELTTARFGDTVLNLSQTPPPPPDGAVNVADALGVLGRFSSAPGSITKSRADLEPGCVDLKVNVSDVLSSLAGFVGLGYPFAPTTADPCDSTCPIPLP